ncbi:AI-2E family transporter [Methanolapillus ohkumae]|uniref:Transport protein YhhT n=1 Tax=Methanolapillus ohkumae TaxID=3028298 RepID=A0AA96ZW49_9EURY|nr:Putative transport protein YhhT [Methanosarcinaceae archaeon Am2]
MPISTNKNVWIALSAIFLLLCLVLVTLFYFQDIFLIFLAGLCLMVIVDKCVRFYNKHTTRLTYLQRITGAVVVIIFLAVTLFLFISFQMESFAGIFSDMSQVQGMIDEGTNLVFTTLNMLPESLSKMLEDYFINFTNNIFLSLTQSFSGLLSRALYYAFAAILLYPIMFKLYFKDGEQIQKRIESYIPKKFKETYTSASNAILTQSNNFFVSKIIESICIGVMSSIGFYLVGIPGWLFFGVLSGLLNNVPYIGPALAAIPPVLIGLSISVETAILAGVVSIIAQAVDNFYLIPYMISDKMDVNPLTTVLVVLVFAQIFGAVGMILSIPIYVIFKIILKESYKQLVEMFPDTSKQKENAFESANG